MTEATRTPTKNDAGFSLLEALVVLTILALTATLSAQVMTRRPAGLDLRATAGDIANAMRGARDRAIAGNSEAVFTIDLDARHYWGDGRPGRKSFRRDVEVDLVTAAPERISATLGRIRWFADGSSTGGTITLSLNGRRAEIETDWLTGMPRVSSQ